MFLDNPGTDNSIELPTPPCQVNDASTLLWDSPQNGCHVPSVQSGPGTPRALRTPRSKGRMRKVSSVFFLGVLSPPPQAESTPPGDDDYDPPLSTEDARGGHLLRQSVSDGLIPEVAWPARSILRISSVQTDSDQLCLSM